MVELVRMTLEQIQAAGGGRVDRTKLAATTEEDIRQHQVEDGEDPDAPLPAYQVEPNYGSTETVVRSSRPKGGHDERAGQTNPDVQAIRERLRMSQDAFARLIDVPVATVRNWEQRRTGIAPTARTLLRILEREPDAALRALAV